MKGNGLMNGYVDEGDLIILVPDFNKLSMLKRYLSKSGYRLVGAACSDEMMLRRDYRVEDDDKITL